MKQRKQGAAVRHSRTKAHARAKSALKRPASGSSHSGVLVLSADCTVAASAALKADLLEALQHPKPVTLDIASVQRIDTAGIQLLAAFVRERESLGLPVEWRGTAPTFASAARLLGVARALGLPEPAQ
jgi:phospholipid transport system transporter-binding protein